jgi:hypothetical protein
MKNNKDSVSKDRVIKKDVSNKRNKDRNVNSNRSRGDKGKKDRDKLISREDNKRKEINSKE